MLGPHAMNDTHSCDIVGFGQIPYEFIFVSQVALSTMSRWNSIKATKTKSPLARSTLPPTYLFYQFHMLLKVLLHCIRIFPVELLSPIPIVDPLTMNDRCSIVYVLSRWNFWVQPIVDPPAMNDPQWYDNVRFEPNPHEFVFGHLSKRPHSKLELDHLHACQYFLIFPICNLGCTLNNCNPIVLFLYYED